MKIKRYELDEIAEEAGIDSEDVRTDYSGRGMYGKTCIGFDLDHSSGLLSLGAALFQILGDGATEIVDRARTDGMGRGIIVYFPGVQVEGEEEDGEEEDDDEGE